jgi:RNA polymerase-associated protein
MSLRAKSKYVPAAKPAANGGLTLFCSAEAVACHWIRIVLAEKDLVDARILVQPAGRGSEDLATLNPSQSLPTLCDREAVIYPAQVIAEFLDERYPHPPLMPPDAPLKARMRMVMGRLEHDFFVLVHTIETGTAAQVRVARKQLSDQLVANSRLFPSRGWFLGLDYGLADCAWTALLWRLGTLGLQLPAGGDAIRRYAERVFARPAFGRSLLPAQRAAIKPGAKT